MDKLPLKNALVASSGFAGGTIFYFAQLHRHGHAVTAGEVNVVAAALFGITAAILATFFWVLAAAIFSRALGTGFRGELENQASCFYPALAGAALLPIFRVFYTRIAGVSMDVVGHVYYPFAGYIRYNFAGYSLLVLLGFCLCFTCFALFFRFVGGLARDARDPGKPLFAALCAFYLIVTSYAVFVYPPTGDETHHLLIAQSLAVDRDIDLENNFMDEEAYRRFYPAYLTPGDEHNTPGAGGQGLYSKHGAGLPFILSPVFAAAGRFGVQAVMCLIAAATGFMLFRYLAGAGVSRNAAIWGTALFALTAPFSVNSSLVLSEIPAALIILYCATFLTGISEAHFRDRNRTALFFAGIAFFPWLHPKLVIFSAVFSAWYVCLGARMKALRLAHEAVNWSIPAVSAAFYALLYSHIFGKGVIESVTGAAISSTYYFIFDIKFTLKAVLAMLFDRNFGLLVNNPLYIIAVWGIIYVSAKNRRPHTAFLLMSAPYAAVFLFWSDWSGSMTPARQLIPVLPAAAAAGIVFMEEKGLHKSRLVSVFAAIAVAISYIYMSFPALRYAGAKEKVFSSLASHGVNLNWFLPYFHDKIGFGHYMTAVYFVAVIGLYFMYAGKEKK